MESTWHCKKRCYVPVRNNSTAEWREENLREPGAIARAADCTCYWCDWFFWKLCASALSTPGELSCSNKLDRKKARILSLIIIKSGRDTRMFKASPRQLFKKFSKTRDVIVHLGIRTVTEPYEGFRGLFTVTVTVLPYAVYWPIQVPYGRKTDCIDAIIYIQATNGWDSASGCKPPMDETPWQDLSRQWLSGHASHQ